MSAELQDCFLRRLLRQARAWFSPHPGRDDAVSVEADPREVRRWMTDTDRALLDDEQQMKPGA